MYSLKHFSAQLFPFLGGISANHLSKKLSPEEYYHEYCKDIFVIALTCPVVSILNTANIVMNSYERITIPLTIVGGIINIGYMYNLYCLNSNISDEVCMQDTQKILDECRQNNYQVWMIGKSSTIDSDIETQDYI